MMKRQNSSCVTLALLLLRAGALGADRQDLLPQDTPVQEYPGAQRVIVDRAGRPWFELAGSATVEEIRQQVEQHARLKSPWVKGAKLLLIDAKDRVWLLADPRLLLLYDPSNGRWTEKRAADNREDGAEGDPSPRTFVDAAFESRSGRVYVPDHFGVHLFDDGRWSYQPLYQLNIETRSYFDFHGPSKRFGAPRFSEGADGRVYVWTRWGELGATGTLGYWVHDGRTWEQRQADPHAGPRRLTDVIGLSHDKVLLCPQDDNALIIDEAPDRTGDEKQIREDIRQLSADAPRDRRDAERRLLERGQRVARQLRAALHDEADPDVRVRLERMLADLAHQAAAHNRGVEINGYALRSARVLRDGFGRVVRDPAGSVFLTADTAYTPRGAKLTDATFRISPDGAVGPLPPQLGALRAISACTDAHGRVFLVSRDAEWVMLEGERATSVIPRGQEPTPAETLFGRDVSGRLFARSGYALISIRPSLGTDAR